MFNRPLSARCAQHFTKRMQTNASCIPHIESNIMYTTMLYIHSTSRMMRFETDGGTPLVAMHRYAPISLRLTFVSGSTSPSYTMAAAWEKRTFSTEHFHTLYIYIYTILYIVVHSRQVVATLHTEIHNYNIYLANIETSSGTRYGYTLVCRYPNCCSSARVQACKH